MARIPVLLNRGGGAVAADPKIAEKVHEAFEAAGIDADIELVSGGECAVRCRAFAERGDDLMVAGGGDGTISAAAAALAGTETVLGILPLGTLNHFARDLGIPTDLTEAVALIARGSERRVDVAEMNDRIFINNSAIGLYPLMVVDRMTSSENASGGASGWRCWSPRSGLWSRFGHQRLTLTVNDNRAQIDTPLLFVGNNDYRVDLGAPGQRDSIDEGSLSVFVMRKKTRRGLHRREHPRLAQSRAPRRHGAARSRRAAARGQPAQPAGRLIGRRSGAARRPRSTTGSASRRCG